MKEFFEAILKFFESYATYWLAGLAVLVLVLFILVFALFGKTRRLKKKVKHMRTELIDAKIALYNVSEDASCKTCKNYIDKESADKDNRCNEKEEKNVMLEPEVMPNQVEGAKENAPKTEEINKKVDEAFTTTTGPTEPVYVTTAIAEVEEEPKAAPVKRQKAGMYKYSLAKLNEIAEALGVDTGKTKAEVITKIKYALNKKMVTKTELLNVLALLNVHGVDTKKKDDLIVILKKHLNKR